MNAQGRSEVEEMLRRKKRLFILVVVLFSILYLGILGWFYHLYTLTGDRRFLTYPPLFTIMLVAISWSNWKRWSP